MIQRLWMDEKLLFIAVVYEIEKQLVQFSREVIDEFVSYARKWITRMARRWKLILRTTSPQMGWYFS